jgi:Ca-activated chloride channel family protein
MEPSPFADDQAGLVVLLKVSGTMLASDVQPTRLERAKHKIRDLLEQRQGASTGMVVYSGSAHLLMPLTRDDRIINAMLEDLTPNLMPVDGDVLVEALKLAEQMLTKSGVPGSVLVVADSVSSSQAQVLSNADIKLPTQFLAVQTTSSTLDSGLQRAASILGANVVKLTNDPADVESVSRRARSKLKTVSSRKNRNRWQDAGYTMLPLLALLILMWSRRGWLVT